MADSPLVKALRRFNRKERYWLLADAIGDPFYELSCSFLRKISSALDVDVPSDAWWAFDYHFDWLHAVLSSGPDFDIDRLVNESPRSNRPEVIKGNQEDIDLIVAFGKTIILIEAKLWTGWSNEQIASKGRRLADLKVEHVQPYFLLTSQKKPGRLKYKYLSAGSSKPDWPDWALIGEGGQPLHVVLSKGQEGEPVSQVSRCDACAPGETPTRTAKGEFWHVFDLKSD